MREREKKGVAFHNKKFRSLGNWRKESESGWNR